MVNRLNSNLCLIIFTNQVRFDLYRNCALIRCFLISQTSFHVQNCEQENGDFHQIRSSLQMNFHLDIFKFNFEDRYQNYFDDFQDIIIRIQK